MENQSQRLETSALHLSASHESREVIVTRAQVLSPGSQEMGNIGGARSSGAQEARELEDARKQGGGSLLSGSSGVGGGVSSQMHAQMMLSRVSTMKKVTGLRSGVTPLS